MLVLYMINLPLNSSKIHSMYFIYFIFLVAGLSFLMTIFFKIKIASSLDGNIAYKIRILLLWFLPIFNKHIYGVDLNSKIRKSNIYLILFWFFCFIWFLLR